MTAIQSNLKVEYVDRFNTQLEQSPREIKIAFRETLDLFLENPNHPQLRNHLLKEKYAGYYSIDVTNDWRALFKVQESKNQTVIIFHFIGTHPSLYGQPKPKK